MTTLPAFENWPSNLLEQTGCLGSGWLCPLAEWVDLIPVADMGSGKVVAHSQTEAAVT